MRFFITLVALAFSTQANASFRKIECAGAYTNGAAILINNDSANLQGGDIALVWVAARAANDPMAVEEFKLEASRSTASSFVLTTMNNFGKVSAQYAGNRLLRIEQNGNAIFFNVDEKGNEFPVTKNLKCL